MHIIQYPNVALDCKMITDFSIRKVSACLNPRGQIKTTNPNNYIDGFVWSPDSINEKSLEDMGDPFPEVINGIVRFPEARIPSVLENLLTIVCSHLPCTTCPLRNQGLCNSIKTLEDQDAMEKIMQSNGDLNKDRLNQLLSVVILPVTSTAVTKKFPFQPQKFINFPMSFDIGNMPIAD